MTRPTLSAVAALFAGFLCAGAVAAGPEIDRRGGAPAGDPAPSLAGAFGDSVPGAVGRYAFAPLGPRWEDWAENTVAAVTSLYDPTTTAAEQRAAVVELRRAVGQLDAAAKAPAFGSVRPELLQARGALARRTRVAAAALAALAEARHVSPAAARRGADRRLGEALAALRADLSAVPGGAAWLPVARADRLDDIAAGTPRKDAAETLAAVVDDLADPTVHEAEQAAFLSRPSWRRLAAAAELRLALSAGPERSVNDRPTALDAARLAVRRFVTAFERYERDAADEAARTLAAAAADLDAVVPGTRFASLPADLYDADNYRVYIGEGLLRRFVAETRRESGAVSDVFRGTRVTGTQTTDVDVDVDVRPEVGAARFDLILDGVAATRTVGRNRQATVDTVGRHRFTAAKTMVYDGTRFRGGRTVVTVDPALRNTRIQTAYDDLAGGLLRGFIQERAFAEADRQQPAALARTRRKLTEQLGPRLDRQIAEQFDAVNFKAGGLLRRRAADLGLAPSRENISSTETEMRVLGRLSDADELAATRPPARPDSGDGAVAQVHHSAINNAADRLDLAGRTVTPDQLSEILRDFAGDLFGREIPAPPADPAATGEAPPTLTFAAADPIRVRFGADAITLVLRVGLTAPPGADGEPGESVPPQIVSVPFAVALTPAGEVTLTRGDLSVAPLDRPESRSRQLAIARVLKGRLEGAIPAESVVPATTTVATDARRRVTLRLASLELADGWATAVLR